MRFLVFLWFALHIILVFSFIMIVIALAKSFFEHISQGRLIKALKGYGTISISFPKHILHVEVMGYLKQLSEFDPPAVPEANKLEYIVSRMRMLNFPEGIIVEYRGKRLAV